MGTYTGETSENAIELELFGYTDMATIDNFMNYFENMNIDSNSQ